MPGIPCWPPWSSSDHRSPQAEPKIVLSFIWKKIIEPAAGLSLLLGVVILNLTASAHLVSASCHQPSTALNTGPFYSHLKVYQPFSERKHLKLCWLKEPWKPATHFALNPCIELRRWGEQPGLLLPGDQGDGNTYFMSVRT